MQVSDLVKEKERQQQEYYYRKYHNVFDYIIEFMKTQDVYVYGGTAIDEYMPLGSKIYDMYELPDIDVFSKDPVRIADQLVQYLGKKGLVASKKNAFHAGTLTVFCEGHKVCDISYITPEYARRLGTSYRGKMGIKLVSMDFLRFTLHCMLATSSPQRWEKVVRRLKLVYEVFPLHKPVWRKHLDRSSDVTAVNEAIHIFTENNNTILLGTPIIGMMVDKVINSIKTVPYNIVIVTGNIIDYAKTIVSSMPEATLTIDNDYSEALDILIQPKHVGIRYKDTTVAIIFKASKKCFSYNKVQGRNVGTIHTMLMFYYSMFLSTDPKFVHMRPALKCIIDALSVVCKSTFTQLPTKNKKLFNQLSLKCNGYEMGLATLRRIQA